jgi:hypothetical protein
MDNDFARLLQEIKAAARGEDRERYSKAYIALMEARPLAPADMARQLRWLIHHTERYPDACVYTATLDHIADQLETLGAAQVRID